MLKGRSCIKRVLCRGEAADAEGVGQACSAGLPLARFAGKRGFAAPDKQQFS